MTIEKEVMIKVVSILSLAAISFIACNNQSEATSSPDTTTVAETVKDSLPPAPGLGDTSISGCYSSIVSRDTTTLQLDVKGSTASGPLTISIFEKDRNDGTFQGEVSAEMIKGWYLFKSEGVMSVRETIFKIQDKKLLPAVGEMIQQNDTMRFKNPAKLKFDETMTLQKVRCVA